jgi:nitroreductase
LLYCSVNGAKKGRLSSHGKELLPGSELRGDRPLPIIENSKLEHLTADQVLTTTRSVKRRLDLSRPVPRALIQDCVEIAMQAPNGGNRQEFRFVVVDDPELKTAVADYYRRAFAVTSQRPQPVWTGARGEQARRRRESSEYLSEHLHEVPALVIHCAEFTAADPTSTLDQAGVWGSVLPAAWSFMLAARIRGLGASWTTLHLMFEKEVGDLLGIPDSATQTGMIPVAFYLGTEFKPALRVPVGDVLGWNRYP